MLRLLSTLSTVGRPQLTTLLLSQISQRKLIAKRRKINTKKLPFSEKKLKQIKHQKGNIYQLQKEEEIRQRLEHRPNINKNINELIEELYFPDLRMQDQDTAGDAYKIQNLEAEALKEQLIDHKPELERQIAQTNLNHELLMLYQAHRDQLTGDTVGVEEIEILTKLVNKMSYCSRFLGRIKQQRLNSWKNYEKKAKARGIKLDCPLKFFDVKDVERHQIWGKLIKDCTQRIESRTALSEEVLVKELELQKQVIRFLGTAPQTYYASLFLKIQHNYPQPANIPDPLKGKVLQSLCYYKKMQLDGRVSVGNLSQQKAAIETYTAQLIDCLVQHPQALDFATIKVLVNFIRRQKPDFLSRQTLHDLQPLIIKPILLQGTFQFVVDTFLIYFKYGLGSMENFEYLKFDLIRKMDQSRKIKAVLELLRVVKDGKVPLYKASLECHHDLVPSIAARIIQEIPFNTLTAPDIRMALHGLYENGYKDTTIHQMLSIEFAKKLKDFTLEDTMDLFFLLTIQGVTSQGLASKVLSRCLDQYHSLLRSYKSERIKYLPNQVIQSYKASINPDKPSEPQSVLQDQLIKFIWSYTVQAGDKFDVDGLFKLYPLNTHSSHPLIHQLVASIYQKLKPLRTFPKIVTLQEQVDNFGKRHLDWAYARLAQTPTTQLLLREAELNPRFVRHMQKSGESERLIIQMKWTDPSEDLRGFLVVRQEQYEDWLLKNPNTDSLFFPLTEQVKGTFDQAKLSQLIADRTQFRLELVQNKDQVKPAKPKASKKDIKVQEQQKYYHSEEEQDQT